MKRHWGISAIVASVLLAGLGVAPAAHAAAPAAPSITFPADGSIVNSGSPAITGLAEADSVITVVVDAETLGTATAGADGAWTFTPPVPLEDGTRVLSALATNGGGEVGAPSSDVTFVVDTVAPSRPTVSSPSVGATITVPQPAITGTGEPSATVLLTVDGVAAGEAVVDSSGNWTLTPSAILLNGSRVLSVRSRDAAGNLSLLRNVSVTVAVPAAAPVVTSPAPNSSTTNVSPIISGTADAGCVVSVRVDGELSGTVTAGESGAWEFTRPTPLSIGDHTVDATCTNPSGATSDSSVPVAFSVATAPVEPPVPEIPSGPEEPATNPGGTSQAALASTGSDVPFAALGAALAAIGAGAGLLAIGRRRRRSQARA